MDGNSYHETMHNEETLSFDLHHPRPLMIIVSGPSGIGKDAVIKELQKRNENLHVVVTMTSRAPRENEVDGVDYHFVSKEEFDELIAQNGFIEHALVYGQQKGIPRDQIQKAVESGRDIILRVDVQGAESLCKIFPDAVTIFLIPTNEKEWLVRLENRKTDTMDELRRRKEEARNEMGSLQEFDYMVVNAEGHLDETVNTIAAIIKAEHHRVKPRVFDI
jgi:guanylate kinase